MKLAAEEIDGNLEPGFLIYGAPVGSDKYCTHQLQLIAKRMVSDAQQTSELLSGERQSLWSALQCSTTHRFDYWLQTCYPSVLEPIAAWLDSHLWKILEAATGLCIPRTTTDAVWNCLLPVPVEGKESISFQGWVVSPPVRLGGFGFRSHQDTAKFAFIGALEQAIPAFQGERDVCPQLAHQMGGDGGE